MVTKEELEHLEKTASGKPRIYCVSPTIFGTMGKRKQMEMYGRTFTKEEAAKYERQFQDVIRCQCGEFMYNESEDLKIKGKHFGSQEFWICDKCNIKMLDCGSTTEVIRTMLDADVEPTEAFSVFDKMQEYHKKVYGHEEESRIQGFERRREEDRLFKIESAELDEIIERGANRAELLDHYAKWNIGQKR